MVKVKDVFQNTKKILLKNNIENAGFEAKELFSKAFGKEYIFFDENSDADEEKCSFLTSLINRRVSGEPLQYILEEWEFYSLPIKVGKGVLIPRQDTEALVDEAIKIYNERQNLTVIDLCSGSGCIGLALEKNLNLKELILVEKSEYAVKYLKENVLLNNSKAEILTGDVLDNRITDSLPTADLIVSNPPYLNSDDMKKLQKEVEFEPETALYGGDDGLDFYRGLSRLYKNKLKIGGCLMFEVGINQDWQVSEILIANGYKNIRVRKDLCGVNRVIIGEKTDE